MVSFRSWEIGRGERREKRRRRRKTGCHQIDGGRRERVPCISPGGVLSKVTFTGRLSSKGIHLSRVGIAGMVRDGAVARAFAFHQCVPGSIPGPGVICGFSLLLVLYSAPRGFFPGTPVFPSP